MSVGVLVLSVFAVFVVLVVVLLLVLGVAYGSLVWARAPVASTASTASAAMVRFMTKTPFPNGEWSEPAALHRRAGITSASFVRGRQSPRTVAGLDRKWTKGGDGLALSAVDARLRRKFLPGI